MLETYREVLRDVLDLPGLHDLLTKLHRRELSLVEVETQTASPFASSLLFDYVATYMYEGDQPNAERRAAALALDRELLRELLGQEELRELIDPGALETVEADLQRLSDRTRADSVDALHDVLRRLGDLTLGEAKLRGGTREWLEQLRGERRAIELRVGGEKRWVAAEDAGLYRDALGAVPPSGLPEAFVADVPDAMERLVRRYARTHGPFETVALRSRYGLDLTPVLERLEQSGHLVRGELRPGGTTREWCDPEVLRRLRRASLAALRAEIEPADQRAFARFQGSWQGIDRHPPTGAGHRPAARGARAAAGPAAAAGGLGARRPAAPHRRLLARVDGPAVRVGRDRLGRRGGVGPAVGPRGAVLPRRRGADRAAAARRRGAVGAGAPGGARAAAGRPVLLHRPADRHLRLHDRGAPERALGPRVGGRGDQRRVRAAALAEAHGDAGVVAARPRLAADLRFAPPRRPARGPGPLVADRRAVRARRRSGRAAAHPGRAAARALRHRHPRAGAGRGHPGRLLLAL